MIRLLLLISILLCSTAANFAGSTTDLDLGGITFSISESRTAQVFYIVDQMSLWDQYAHRQYSRWAVKNLELTSQDQQLLQKHAEMRRVRGWGNGFEQAFLVDDPIDVAAAKAVRAKVLSADEAEAERRILTHFVPKLSGLIAANQSEVTALRNRLISQARQIRRQFLRLRHFAEISGPFRVSVFLIVNPEEGSGGGEANGGRLAIEVEHDPDPLTFLFHESMHMLLNQHLDQIKAAAQTAGLDWQVLNEGIAYAIGPGLIYDRKDSDSLIEALVRNLVQGKTVKDIYTQFFMAAAVIRPLLRSALARGETITTFLPKAVRKWRSVVPPDR